MPDHVRIFDTTLRDGEQSPGINLSAKEKVEIGTQLANLGVDVIEAGFPVNSPTEFDAVEAVARNVKGPVIAALARMVPGDIDTAWASIKDAQKTRIHTFIATSPIHLEKKLRMTTDEGMAARTAGAGRAAPYPPDAASSAEDAPRSNPDFLCKTNPPASRPGPP